MNIKPINGMKTSKVKTITSVKPYNGQNGTVHYHNLIMENGDKINIGKKKEVQVGWELNYEIVGDQKEDGTYQQEYPKAKSVQPQNVFKASKNNSTASFALSYAKDMMCMFIETEKVTDKDADKIADKAIVIANKFNNWLKTNS